MSGVEKKGVFFAKRGKSSRSSNPSREEAQTAAKILISSIGGSPAILTETLWALKQKQWIPDKIYVVTTCFEPIAGELSNIDRIVEALSLRDAEGGPFGSLFGVSWPTIEIWIPSKPDSDVSTSILAFVNRSLKSPFEPKDTLLKTIDSYEDALQMGECIFEVVKKATESENSEVHVSTAGGYKTMSSHCLVALTTFGRLQDSASHTLVSPGYERLGDFWHPHYKPNTVLNGTSLKPRDAKVNLIETPFVPLPSSLKKADTDAFKRLTLAETMRRIRAARQFVKAPKIDLIIEETESGAAPVTKVVLGCETFAVTPRLFLCLLFLSKFGDGFSKSDFKDLGVFDEYQIIRNRIRDEPDMAYDPLTQYISLHEYCEKHAKGCADDSSKLNAASAYEFAIEHLIKLGGSRDGWSFWKIAASLASEDSFFKQKNNQDDFKVSISSTKEFRERLIQEFDTASLTKIEIFVKLMQIARSLIADLMSVQLGQSEARGAISDLGPTLADCLIVKSGDRIKIGCPIEQVTFSG